MSGISLFCVLSHVTDEGESFLKTVFFGESHVTDGGSCTKNSLLGEGGRPEPKNPISAPDPEFSYPSKV